MTTFFIWVITPLAVAILLWLFRNLQKLTTIIGAITCFILATLTWMIPFDGTLTIGALDIEIVSTLSVLGRRFVLDSPSSSTLQLFYFSGGIWIAVAYFIKVHKIFVPLSITIITLLIAALAVQPFLYASLIIEMAVLTSIPLLVPPGKKAGLGITRYVIYQTLALPFMLLAGWVSSGVEANPTDRTLLIQVLFLLGFGFAFLLAVFPFYTWIPMLTEQTNPYYSCFILNLLSITNLIFALNFINNFVWLREVPYLGQIFRIMGAIMVITAGIWSAFQNNLLRVLGYMIILENGFTLLCLSGGNADGVNLFFNTLLPRMLNLGLFSLGLVILRRHQHELNLKKLQGTLGAYPMTSIAILISIFSTAGLPLLAGFPVKISLLENLGLQSLSITTMTYIGLLGLMIFGFRTLTAVYQSSIRQRINKESVSERLILGIGLLAIVFIGIFPNQVSHLFESIITHYEIFF